jgi:alkylmercury lyase-like protein
MSSAAAPSRLEEATKMKKAPGSLEVGRELPMKDSENKLPTIGFSPTPTLYKLHWNGGDDEYVCCGADILLNGLEGDLVGQALCPVCHNSTRLVIASGKIDGLDPRDAIIHVVEMPAQSGRIWIECDSTHIFDKEECFQKWIAKSPGMNGLVESVVDYHNRLMARRSKKSGPQYLAKRTR